MSELDAFVAACVNVDLAGAGAFADWLDDRSDPRGRLLRLRWKRWQTDRRKAELAVAHYRERIEKPIRDMIERARALGAALDATLRVTVSDATVRDVDEVFRAYIVNRFPTGAP